METQIFEIEMKGRCDKDTMREIKNFFHSLHNRLKDGEFIPKKIPPPNEEANL